MRKISMTLMVAAIILFAACGGKKSETSGECEAKNPDTEASVPAETSGNLVDEYLGLIDEAIPLLEKVQKGDADAVAKYGEISQKLADLTSSTDFQTEIANLTPEQATKYQEAVQKLAAAATAGQ
jgi:hypothetical protein